MGKQSGNQKRSDFSRGNVVGSIMKLAIPMTLAQLINVSYSIMDRIYIGMTPENAILSLTGLDLCPPIISIMVAFVNLPDMGDVPLCSIEKGRGNEREAEVVTGSSFAMVAAMGILLTVLGLTFKRSTLYLSGASDATISYADTYVVIYPMSSTFVMTGLGMNSSINSRGFGAMGMMTVLPGTVTNTVLGPVFISILHMGVRGAALAIIFSQILSALWILAFLTGGCTILKLRPSAMKLDAGRSLRIVGLGISGFTMSITNSPVQIIHNSMLQKFGGDLYVGIMTAISSVREATPIPVNGLTNSTQPVLGYNYGIRKYKRVQKAIIFMFVACILYTVVVRGFVGWFPTSFIRIFNRERGMVEAGIPAMRMYLFGFFMMSLQFVDQSVFMGLRRSRNTVLFSIFRKVTTVTPLIIMLSTVLGMETQGTLMAEFIPNFVGGAACSGTMLLTAWFELKRGREKGHS